MKGLSKRQGAVVGVITVIITQLILRMVDISEYSTIGGVTALIILAIVIPVMLLRNTNNKLGRKLSIAISSTMSVSCIINAISLIFFELDTNNQHDMFAVIIVALSLLSFVAIFIVGAIAFAAVSERK